MPYEERPSTPKSRVLVSGAIWLVLGPFLVALWFLLGWISLLFVIGSVWWTRSYIRSGGDDLDYVARAGGWGGKHRLKR